MVPTSLVATSSPWHAVCVHNPYVAKFVKKGERFNRQQEANNQWLVDSFTANYAVQAWAVGEDGELDAVIVKNGQLCTAVSAGVACLQEGTQPLSADETALIADEVRRAVKRAFDGVAQKGQVKEAPSTPSTDERPQAGNTTPQAGNTTPQASDTIPQASDTIPQNETGDEAKTTTY